MRRDFNGKGPTSKQDRWYDIFEDWALIESSFAQQYSIRLRNEPEMSWDEFCTLLAGIMAETPLGQIVTIRSENDQEQLKHFSEAQRNIRNAWRNRSAKQAQWSQNEAAKAVDQFQQMMKNMFG